MTFNCVLEQFTYYIVFMNAKSFSKRKMRLKSKWKKAWINAVVRENVPSKIFNNKYAMTWCFTLKTTVHICFPKLYNKKKNT